ncbi:MAG TPA: hypothetical protein VFS21_08680 [Roseiflexaceae bacterium]|nr:hypothetical protein [Roseiflexaceae bacterium]
MAEGPPDLKIPPTAATAARLAARLARCDRWAGRIAARQHTLVRVEFGARLRARLDRRHALSDWAEAFSQRLLPGAGYSEPADLPVTPYAPPLRQLSAARQGAAEWSQGVRGPSRAAPAAEPAPTEQSVTAEALLRELESLGWS